LESVLLLIKSRPTITLAKQTQAHIESHKQ
jgi:hypothetical protein